MNTNKPHHPIDELFRKGLGQHSPAPPPAVWKNISRRLRGGGAAGLLRGYLITTAGIVLLATAWLTIHHLSSPVQDQPALSHARSSSEATPASQNSNSIAQQTSVLSTDQIAAGSATPQSGSHLKQHAYRVPHFTKPLPKSTLDDPPQPIYNVQPSFSGIPKQDNHVQEETNAPFAETAITASPASVATTYAPAEGQPMQNPSHSAKDRVTETSIDSGSAPATQVKIGWWMGANAGIGEILASKQDPDFTANARLYLRIWLPAIQAAIESGVGYRYFTNVGTVENVISMIDSAALLPTKGHLLPTAPDGTLGHTTILADSVISTSVQFRSRYIEIPLLFDKQVVAGKHLGFDLATGPVVGFFRSEKYDMPNLTLPQGTLLKATQVNHYTRQQTIWEWQFTPRMRYCVNRSLEIYLQATSTLFLNNLYKEDNPSTGNPFEINLAGGLHYRIK